MKLWNHVLTLPFKQSVSTINFGKNKKKSWQSHLKPYTLTQPFHGDICGVFCLSQSDSCIWRLYGGVGMARKLLVLILVVTKGRWVEKGRGKPIWFIPSFWFDCHLFLLTFAFLFPVGSTWTFPSAQQLGLSANQAPAWLSAAGKVKQALSDGVVSGAE